MRKPLRIAILGTRGIPNAYGGFEQCAQYLAEGLVHRGHDVSVFASHLHPYQQSSWNGVKIIHCMDPEDRIGTIGQFMYDLNGIIKARRQSFEVVMQFGYTSSSIWFWLWPKKARHLVNMDGLEFKRSKYSGPVRRFLRLAERLAVRGADLLIADNKGIEDYLMEKYDGKPIRCIPYGAEDANDTNPDLISEWGLLPYQYDLVVCRMEPENHVETILQAHELAEHPRELILIGNASNRFGTKMHSNYKHPKVRFIGSLYDKPKLDALRYYCHYYLHGHSVGGTNPSLLEAMAYSGCILAHDNPFNRNVLGTDGGYFENEQELAQSLCRQVSLNEREIQLQAQRSILKQHYAWSSIVDAYESACYEMVDGQ